MPYVIVVEQMQYARVYDQWREEGTDRRENESGVLGAGEAFARALDRFADQYETPSYQAIDPNQRTRPLDARNPVSHCIIPLPPSWNARMPAWLRPGAAMTGSNRQQLEASFHSWALSMQAEIIAQTLPTYQRAAAWSRPGGVVSILVGHGGPTYGGPRAVMTADVAPVEAGRISTPDLEWILEQGHGRRASGIDTSTWPAKRRLVHEMGIAFRRNHVRRVDFLTCSVGMTFVGQRGQRFLDLLQVIWGCPVRGLIGDFAPGAENDQFVWEVYGRQLAPDNPSLRSSWHSQSQDYTVGRSWDNEAADFPGYVPDRLFRSSTGRLTR